MKSQESVIWGTCLSTAVQMPFLYIQVVLIKITTIIFVNIRRVLSMGQALWYLALYHECIIEFLSS